MHNSISCMLLNRVSDVNEINYVNKVGIVAPVDDMMRRMHGRVESFLAQFIDKDGKMVKKSTKVLPRGDYLEFARLVSVRLF